MLHTSLIAAIYYNLAVVLFSLISLSCSWGGSVIGIRDRTGLGGEDPESWPTDTSWHRVGTGTLRRISHYTGHITQERALLNQPWNQAKKKRRKKKEKVNKLGAQYYSIVWDPGLCVSLVSQWVYQSDPTSSRSRMETDRERQTWLLTCRPNDGQLQNLQQFSG